MVANRGVDPDIILAAGRPLAMAAADRGVTVPRAVAGCPTEARETARLVEGRLLDHPVTATVLHHPTIHLVTTALTGGAPTGRDTRWPMK